MKNLLFFFSLLFLTACASQKFSTKLPLFNTVNLQLMEGEREVKDLTRVSVEFQKLVTPETIQIPLYKYIKGEESDIFVGLPLGLTLSSDEMRYVSSDYLLKTSKFEQGKWSYKVYTKGETYLVEYMVKMKNSKFYSLFRTESSRTMKTMLDLENVKERFK